MTEQQLWELAVSVPALIPEEPESGDVLDWLGWRELVWSTAGRLAELGGALLVDMAPTADVSTIGPEVGAFELLGLAASMTGRDRDDQRSSGLRLP